MMKKITGSEMIKLPQILIAFGLFTLGAFTPKIADFIIALFK
jgi:hypothetical protein